jgi:hypothetical protein
MSKETMRLHEAARRNGKAAKNNNKMDIGVGAFGKEQYERVWREVMVRQKEEENKEERRYVEKWLRSVE